MARIDPLSLRLLELLRSAREPLTSRGMAGALGVSEKTIRTHMKELARAVADRGGEIGSKTGTGYWITETDPGALDEFLRRQGGDREGDAPPTRWERAHLVIRCLLSHDDCIRIETLDELLFTNRTSVKRELSRAREYLERYDLRIISRSRRGIRLEGRERDIRLCLCAEGDPSRGAAPGEEYWDSYALEGKRKAALEKLVCEYVAPLANLSVYSVSWLARLIWISAVRNGMGRCLTAEEAPDEELSREACYPGSRALLDICGPTLGTVFREEDVLLVSAVVAALRVPLNRSDLDVPSYRRSHRAAVLLAGELGRLNGFEHLGRDQVLISQLALFLPGMFLRQKLHIFTGQFSPQEQAECSVMAKKLAVQAMDHLNRNYGMFPDEEETLRLAMVIRPVFGRYPREIRKLRACCVSSADKAVGTVMAERLMRNFGRYLESVEVREIYELKEQGCRGIQVLFTSYPPEVFDFLNEDVLRIQAGPFFGEEEKSDIRQKLVARGTRREASYYDFLRADHLFPNVNVSDRDECFAEVARRLAGKDGADGELLADLKRSHAIAPFRPRGGVVFLTPIRSHTEKTTVAVFTLSRATLWNGDRDRVRVVVYWDRGREFPDPNLFECEVMPRMLEMTFADRRLVDSMVRRPDFGYFMNVVRDQDRILSGTSALL